MKHTPAPWKVHLDGIRQDDEGIYRVILLDLPPGHAGNAVDDKNLIQAAPELLDIVKLAIESQGWDGNDPNEERWIDFYSNARAAKAKAEGKA